LFEIIFDLAMVAFLKQYFMDRKILEKQSKKIKKSNYLQIVIIKRLNFIDRKCMFNLIIMD